MKESREYMLHVLWRTMDPIDKMVFMDKTEQYFLPRLKFEKSRSGDLEIYSTTSDIYYPIEESLVAFAYENTLRALSDSLCYSNEVDKTESLCLKKELVPEHVLLKHQQRLELFKSKTNIHVNQIKENYGNKQREDSEAIQEVQPHSR